MDNLMLVVSERNRAFNLLEKGITGEPEKVEYTNELGRWLLAVAVFLTTFCRNYWLFAGSSRSRCGLAVQATAV